MKSNYKTEIIPNKNQEENREGLRILARIIARKFLAEYKEVLEDNIHEQHI